MTQEEQQQVAAAMKFMEQQIARLASEGAIVASQLEAVAIKLKAAEDELAALKAPKVDGGN
jgi:hypothetical protein